MENTKLWKVVITKTAFIEASTAAEAFEANSEDWMGEVVETTESTKEEADKYYADLTGQFTNKED